MSVPPLLKLAKHHCTVIIYQSTEIRTGPLYYTIVGTVITNQGTEIRTGPLYDSIVGTVIIT